MNRKVYLDHNASTPVHPDVIQAMLPYFGERFGNPSSVHGFGREARDGMETAREQVVALPQGQERGDRVHLRRHRVGQHGDQGHRACAAPRPHHHLADRAPRGPAHVREPRGERIRGDLSAGRRLRDGRPRGRAPRHSAGHHPRHADARELRGGHHPAHARDRAHHPRDGDPAPRGRGADRRQGPHRRGRLRDRPPVLLGPQDLRPQGRGRALHPPGDQDGLRPARGGARAEPPRRYGERGGHRRPRRGGGDPRARDDRRRRAPHVRSATGSGTKSAPGSPRCG